MPSNRLWTPGFGGHSVFRPGRPTSSRIVETGRLAPTGVALGAAMP
ncbi:hypothetical protein OG976_16140 [Mycobacterium sp. NBC_00419]